MPSKKRKASNFFIFSFPLSVFLFLQVQDSFLDFLCSALIPVLGADVAAGSSRDVHRGLVGVAAVRAFPDELVSFVRHDSDFAGVAAFLAAVALCVQLGIHYVVVDVLEQCHDSRNVVLHVRNFNIAHGSAR